MIKKTLILLKDFLLSFKVHQIAFYSGTVLLLLSVFSTIFNKPYLVIGVMHDLWMPKIGAYAIKHGLTLHQDFYTPFGFIYNGLNYISLLIIESFPSVFNLFDMIMLSSLLFSLIVVGLFYFMRINTAKAIPVIFLLMILSFFFQIRTMNDVFFVRGISYLWHVSYNKHVWGLLLLQIIHLFFWKRHFVKNAKDAVNIERNNLTFFLTIQVICAYIFFNYKINFFVSSSLVIFSIFFVLPLRLWLKYMAFSASLFLMLISLTFILTQYSYIGYIKDLYHVGLSRYDTYFSLDIFFTYLFVFFLIRISPGWEVFKYHTHQLKLFLTANKAPLANGFVIDVCMGLLLFIGVTIDKERLLLYCLAAISLFFITNRKALNIKKGLYWLLTVLLVINASFLANIYLGLNYLFAYVFIFFLIRMSILSSLKSLLNKKRPLDFFRYHLYNSSTYYLHKIRGVVTNNNFLFMRLLLFDVFIGLSILVGMKGDAAPFQYFFVAVFLFYLAINTTHIKRVSYFILLILFMINVFSLANVTIFFDPKKEQSVSDSQRYQKYKTHSIKTKDKKYSFIVEDNDDMDEVLNKLKEKYPKKTKDILEGVFDPFINFYEIRNPANNIYYIDFLNNVLSIFHNKLNKNDRVLMLEFTDPLPLLLDFKPIQGSYHWFHLKRTFSFPTLHKFDRSFENADFIYAPLFPVIYNHNLLTCRFYKWNNHHKRFSLSLIHKYGFLFATDQKIKEYNLEKIEFPNPDKITESCLAVYDEQKKAEKNYQSSILKQLLQKISNSL